MSGISSKARRLRLEYQAKIGRSVSVQEVADTVGLTRKALTNIELDKTERIDFETLRNICDFYSRVLERPVGVGDVLEYDPNKMTLDLLAA